MKSGQGGVGLCLRVQMLAGVAGLSPLYSGLWQFMHNANFPTQGQDKCREGPHQDSEELAWPSDISSSPWALPTKYVARLFYQDHLPPSWKPQGSHSPLACHDPPLALPPIPGSASRRTQVTPTFLQAQALTSG